MNSIRIHLNTVRAYQRGEIKWQRRVAKGDRAGQRREKGQVKVRQDKREREVATTKANSL